MPHDAEDIDLQNQNAYDDLLVAIETGVGTLSLLIAVCDDPAQRDEIIQHYEQELAPEFEAHRLTLARGEPSLKAAIAQELEKHESLRQGGKAILTITGTEQLYFLTFGEAKSEQEIFFGYLQWTREALREFRFPIILWLTHQMVANLSRKSPDFWSWRKGVFRFASRKRATVAAAEMEGVRSALKGLDLPEIDEDTLLPLEDLKALIQKTADRNPNDPLLAGLYNQMGRIYAGRLERGEAQDYRTEAARAIEYFEKAISLQAEPGQELDLANSLNWLGYLYKSQGRYSEAEALYVQALELRQRLLGEEHSAVANILNNLAGLYDSQGRYSEAEPLYVQALEMSKRLLGEDHPDVANSLNNLAGLYESQGRYSEAEPLYVQALEMSKRLLGEEHSDVATRLNNLAALYDSQGRYSEAEPLYVQALDMSKRLLGEDHPAVATSLNNLAYLYYSQGRYSEAEPLYVQALDMSKRLLGEEHPDVATRLNNLALLYESQGRYSEAEPLYVQALKNFEQQLGENHPNTVTVRENLQGLQDAMQKLQPGKASSNLL
ncbi:MAG: tetratricopeptide repeat protein [Oscillatoriophycideae cyanobacterium NC_groundwater_1537_Pr4_S-0.65um_50_18]|nr:tetratricopeptide repeat protein [Oscillatoriophycideae cyanobacterium NC_groundwater_1537_Pr4_S-0.65um_50_18]